MQAARYYDRRSELCTLEAEKARARYWALDEQLTQWAARCSEAKVDSDAFRARLTDAYWRLMNEAERAKKVSVWAWKMFQDLITDLEARDTALMLDRSVSREPDVDALGRM
jgi:hypothetical protein